MAGKHSNGILIGIFAALILSAITVLICNSLLAANPEFVSTYKMIIGMGTFLGNFFLTALRMIIVPLILASVIVGITSLGDVRKIGSIGTKTIGFYAITTALAVGLGLFLVTIFQPGKSLSQFLAGESESSAEVVLLEGETQEQGEARQKIEQFREQFGKADQRSKMESIEEKKEITVADLLLSFIHPNIMQAFSEGQMLPIILFALILGGILTTLPSIQGEPVIAFFNGLNEAMMKFIHLIMYLAPIGIFGIVVNKFGEASLSEGGIGQMIAGVASYSGVLLLGLGIHTLITLPLLLWFLTKRNPLTYAFQMSPALLLAWSCSSSSATLPVTMESASERAGVNKKAVGFVLPLGATVNMDGTALYEAVAVIFIAQAYGVDLSALQLVLVFLTATFASIGAAGVPQAGLVMMVIVLNAVGLPIEGIEMILMIDWLLDRFRTLTNVWGDSIGAAYVGDTMYANESTNA
ncbi:MAG: dicarboxylate/amino acid:cation symporter [Sumerlaeia bacterium]